VDDNGEKINLNRFIIKYKLYSITFTDFKYMYFMGACFQDTSGKVEVMALLNIFQPQQNMDQVTDEKGTKKNLDNNSKNFPKNSMFNLIEKIQEQQGDDYIFCDDLGDEWADHITFNKRLSRICFIHSKHGEISRSASKLHDVVGQGIKNLGNMFFSMEQIWDIKFKDKAGNDKKLLTCYSRETKISRLRYPRLRSNNYTAKEIEEIKKELTEILQDRKLYRQCILSCSFLSKKAIQAEFEKLAEQQKVAGNISQLFWILSSFVCACKERGVVPVIYCED